VFSSEKEKGNKSNNKHGFSEFFLNYTLPFCSETKPLLDADADLTLSQEQVFVSALFHMKIKNYNGVYTLVEIVKEKK